MRTLRLGLVAVLLLPFGCSGSCGRARVTYNEPRLAFEFPLDGSVLGPTDDVSSAAGIQSNVQATVTNMNDGDSIYLWNSVDGAAHRVEGTVSGDRVVFPGYTLPSGAVILRVAIPAWEESMKCEGDRCAQVTVTVKLAACAFNDPADGSVLTAENPEYVNAQDPFDPFEVDVELDCFGGTEGEVVLLRVNGGLPRTAVLGALSGLPGLRATFLRVPLAEGPNALAAVPQVAAASGAPTTATVTVDTARCLAVLEPIDGAKLLAKDDADLNPVGGMQATLDLVTNCGSASTVTMHYRKRSANDPQPAYTTLILSTPPVATADPLGWRFRMTSVQLDESAGPSRYDIELVGVVEENPGQSGVTLPTRYWVDSNPPTVVPLTPGPGGCYVGSQDLYTAIPGIQTDANGNVAGAEDGAEVWVMVYPTSGTATACVADTDCAAPQLCRDAFCRGVGTVTAGSFIVRQVDLGDGDVTVEYTALDVAGNRSAARRAQVTVSTTPPTVTISAPDDQARLGVADDMERNIAGLQYDVGLTLANVPAGSIGRLLTGDATYNFVPPVGVGGTILQPVSLSDGAHTLVARVKDVCNNDVDSAPITVTVSSSPAAVVVTPYVADNSGCAVNDQTACASAAGCMWNATGAAGCVADFTRRRALADGLTIRQTQVDLDVATGLGLAGYPRTVTVEVFPGSTTTAGVRQCAGVPAAGPIATVFETAGGVLFTGVPLASGQNCIAVSVDDAINNLSENVLVTVKDTAPVPTFNPAVAASPTDSNGGLPGFNQTLTVELAAADTQSGVISVTVGKGGTVYNVLSAPIGAGATSVTFTDASLPSGTGIELTPVYTDALGNTASGAMATITTPAAGPELVISAPPAGSATGNTAFEVHAVYVGAEASGTYANAACSLFIDGSANGTATWTEPTAAPLVIDTAADASEATHDVRVECGSGVSQTIRVTIDDTAPPAPDLRSEDPGTPGRLVFSPPGYVNTLVADDSGLAGLQHSVGVVVHTGGADPAGWTVSLSVTPPGAGSATTYSTVLATGGDPVLVTFGNVDFGVATSGSISFQARVTDLGGNQATGTAATLTVDMVPPVLTQQSPPPSQTLLSRSDDANVDSTYVDYAFKYDVTGDAVGNVSLTIDPPPQGKTASDFPLTLPATATVSFPTLAFADGLYRATASVSDLAGNVAPASSYSFEVKGLEARVNWAIPGGPGSVNNGRDNDPNQTGIQATFAFNVVAFAPGTTLKLCSTEPTAGAVGTCAAGSELDCCRWHPDGNPLNIRTDFATPDPTAGYVIATGVLVGSLAASSAFMSAVTLADGLQTIHAEVVAPDKNPDSFSSFFAFSVDSVPPSVSAVDYVDNKTANDQSGYFLLGETERTRTADRLRTRLDITVTGSTPGRSVDVLSDVPAASTVVSVAGVVLGGDATTQIASVDVDLYGGRQHVFVRVSDDAGNYNDVTTDLVASQDVVVDLIPPTVSLPGPAHGAAPYTSADGTPDGNQKLGVGVLVAVADNEDLAGGQLTLRSFDAAAGGTALESAVVTLTAGQTSISFPAFLLHMGKNYLEAELVDAAGNKTTTARTLYPADFYGPGLTLQVWSVSPLQHQSTCEVDAVDGCVADYKNPDNNDGLALLDLDATDPYRNNGGTDLRYTLSGLVNSDATIEASAATVWLESLIVGVTSTYEEVDTSRIGVATDLTLGSYPAGYRLAPGVVRAVRVAAIDSNDNVSHSDPIYLKLSLDGVLVVVERLNGLVPPGATGDFLANDIYWGPAENLGAPGAFATNLRVRVTRTSAAALTPTTIDFQVNTSTTADVTLATISSTVFEVDFSGVVLRTSPHPGDRAADKINSVIVTVNCAAAANCGLRQYNNIIADIDPPTFQFDRCSLCKLGVPLTGGGICPTDLTTCVDAGQWDGDNQANMVGAASPAVWNAAGDQDLTPSNGFTILATGKPLTVRLLGVEPGERVRLVSNRGGLTGNDEAATGCPTCQAGSATFRELNVPTLAGAEAHQLTVAFMDRAGNQATITTPRDPETLYAKTDVLVPGAAQATCCIGESTTPYTVSTPASDPSTYEDPSCAAHCAVTGKCDRRKGKATLVWQAPAEDGASGGAVVSYQILVAARGIPYPQPPTAQSVTYTQCAELVATDAAKVEQVVNVTATAAPGGQERAGITDLYPHRSYCFAVLGVDDAGNKAVVASSVRERAMPLVNYPQVVGFDPVSPVDDSAAAALASVASSTWFGNTVTALGDLDGDGRGDFGVTRRTEVFSVSLFLSSGSLTSPDVVIMSPANGPGLFGVNIAGGDFDGDGLSDLAVCAPTMPTTGATSSGAAAGALYLYYGKAGEGIRRDLNTTDFQLPSVTPDVALLGPANARFCYRLSLGDVDGRHGADIVVTTQPTGNKPRVYGFFGGSRSRFPSSGSATSLINLDLVSTPSSGFANRPELSLQRKASLFGLFPFFLTVADVNGDGAGDVVVSDNTASHDSSGSCNNCGEVYVYRGGAGLVGDVAAPDSAPSQLMTVLRYPAGGVNFGQTLLGITNPLGAADLADWLLVQAAGNGQVFVYKGTALGGSPGIVPSPAALDPTDWTGLPPTQYGNSLAAVGDFDGLSGVDILVGPGYNAGVGNFGVYLYSLDVGAGGFVKRAILRGAPSFGTGLAAANGFVPGTAATEPQMVLSTRDAGSIYLFR
ncbi:MAG: hypothetical protein HY903_20690 [Deltaproteobacteria bacterium]|nr:hypothetical protein [Deltaproteobacteria bacterium]